MNGDYQYTPYIWPMLASATFLGTLGIYAWRYRTTPGALAFTAGSTLTGLWALGNACELSATDPYLEFWWLRLQMIVSTPAAVAGLCFVLQYAGLGRWLNRATLTLLIAPSILTLPAYLLGDAHLMWGQVEYVDGRSVRFLAPLGVAWNLYGLAVLALTVAVVILLFVRSPLYRKPAALMTLGHTAIVGAQVLEMLSPAPASSPSLLILSIDFAFAMYAVALFRYRLFGVVPVARDSAVERMPDPMVVLDASNRIADLNLAAQQLLGVRRARALGREAAQALAAVPGLVALTDCHAPAEGEVSLGEGSTRRWYRVNNSPLEDGRGFHLGCLLVLHETTQLRLAQERLLQQERALAALHEREQLARELHDSVGQVLAYVSLQADAARKLLDDGRASLATNQLERLASIARDAHADVREFILALRAAPAEQRAFFPALRRYLEGFTQNYGIVTTLAPPDGLEEAALEPEAEAQLFRIIQEALSNARRHGCARSVTVTFERQDRLAQVVIRDDGEGFDPGAAEVGFGLRFMGERAAEVGGSVEVQSAPGEGTTVVVALPLRQAQEV